MAKFPLWCDCCGDSVKAVYPCKFIFPDGEEIPFDICLDCRKNGKLIIDMKRQKTISIFLKNMKSKDSWRKRSK